MEKNLLWPRDPIEKIIEKTKKKKKKREKSEASLENKTAYGGNRYRSFPNSLPLVGRADWR